MPVLSTVKSGVIAWGMNRILFLWLRSVTKRYNVKRDLIGAGLTVSAAAREQSATLSLQFDTGDDHHHQQVRRDAVMGEPRDGPVHPSFPAGSATRTDIPSVTVARLEMEIRSPAARPAATIAHSSS